LVFLIHTELRCTVNHTSDLVDSHWQCCNLDRSNIVNNKSERSDSFVEI